MTTQAFPALFFCAGLSACASGTPSQPSAPAPVAASAPAANDDDPEPTAPPIRESAATTQPTTGIPSCDEFLAAYRVCEPDLAAEIALGNRRKYSAEEAWITYMKTTSEAPGLAGACESKLAELRNACPRAPR